MTASADQGTRQTIRRIVRSNPGVKVVVTGCNATRRPEEISELPNVVQVVSNDAKDTLVAALDAAGELTTARRFDGGEGPCGLALEPGVAGRTALILRVQTGCDEACSYCIIPRTRGAGRSRPPGDVIRDIRLPSMRINEITIPACIGSCGRDLGDGTRSLTVRSDAHWRTTCYFGQFARADGLHSELSTPRRVLRGLPRISPPLQHGSDAVLAAMRRHGQCIATSSTRSVRLPRLGSTDVRRFGELPSIST